MTKVSVLGLGIIGGGIARNLAGKGFATTVWNRTPERAEPFRALGARVAESPETAASGADVVIDAVTDVDASREVWTGPHGALAAMAPGSAAVECATLSVKWVRRLHAQAVARGIAYIDCPVTGSKVGADTGTLTLLTGAEWNDLERVRPVLEAFSKLIFRFGPPPAGTQYKLVNNLLLAAQILSAGEGMAITEACGLDGARVTDAICAGAMASPIVKNKLRAILAREYGETQFALRWMLKDLRYGLELADEMGLRLPAARLVCDLYAEADGRGWGGRDYAAVADLPRKPSGGTD
ncbi:MAG: NAD(P)-dependent oxidoreductase [Anaerolineales bacterium]